MRQTFSNTLNVIFLTVAALLASTNNAFATTGNCVNATAVELDSVHRGFADEGTEIIRIDVPSAGIAALDVTVSATANAEPKIGFLGRRCSKSADPEAAVIDKGISRQTVAFRTAGEYYFRVAAQDPTQALGSHQIHARFVPAATTYDEAFETPLRNDRGSATVRQTDFFFGTASRQEPTLSLFAVYDSNSNSLEDEDVDPDPNGLEDEDVDPDPNGLEDEDVDPDPNGFTGTRPTSTRGFQGLEDEDVDPDPNGLEDEDVDPDPNGFKSDEELLDSMVVIHGQGALQLDFCRTFEADDHQDIFGCATTLTIGTAVRGKLDNDWQDDADVFSLELSASTSLEITTQGESDTRGGLYDAYGQLLAADDDKGDANNFRIVKSLPPGQYFVRVEGHGNAGTAYELQVENLEW